MKIQKITPFLALTALLFSGCSLSPDANGKQQANLLGIIKYEQASYQHVGPNTVQIASDEVVKQKEYSGDKLSLLWGLITLKDY